MKTMTHDDESEMDSLYASGEPSKGKGEQETIDQEEAENDATAMVPNKVLMGKHTEPLKEGDEVVLKVVKNYGDECEVAYSETKPGDIGEGEGGYEDADKEIDKMDNPGMSY